MIVMMRIRIMDIVRKCLKMWPEITMADSSWVQFNCLQLDFIAVEIWICLLNEFITNDNNTQSSGIDRIYDCVARCSQRKDVEMEINGRKRVQFNEQIACNGRPSLQIVLSLM